MTTTLPALILATALLAQPPEIGGAGAETGLTYIVPAAAGSFDAPQTRPPAPDMLFLDASGLPQHLRVFLGQVVVLTFWAASCGPCLKQMTFLDRLQGDLKAYPLKVLALTEDPGGIAAAKALYKRQNFTFLLPYADAGGLSAAAMGIRGLPTNFVIDRQGRIAIATEGPFEWDNPRIVARLKRLLAEH